MLDLNYARKLLRAVLVMPNEPCSQFAEDKEMKVTKDGLYSLLMTQ
jgi:hypothetical protein